MGNNDTIIIFIHKFHQRLFDFTKMSTWSWIDITSLQLTFLYYDLNYYSLTKYAPARCLYISELNKTFLAQYNFRNQTELKKQNSESYTSWGLHTYACDSCDRGSRQANRTKKYIYRKRLLMKQSFSRKNLSWNFTIIVYNNKVLTWNFPMTCETGR